MDKKIKTVLAAMCLILFVFIAGCAGKHGYGKTTLTARSTDKMTIETLAKNWKDYHVYYTGTEPKVPWGILFDKKDDGRTLTSEHWVMVEDGDSISGKAQWMMASWPTTRLFTILGPENEFYGYVFTRWTTVVTKLVEKDTLYVYDLKLYDRPAPFRRVF